MASRLSAAHGVPDAYTRYTVSSPFAAVSGRMEVGDREIAAHGWCCAERGVVNVPMRRLNPEESSFRVFGPGATPQEGPWMISLMHGVSAEAYGSRRVSTLLVGRGRQWILATGEGDLEALDYSPGEGSPVPYPRRLRLRAAREFVVTDSIALNDLLARLPGALREVAKAFVTRPVIHRDVGYFRGSLEFPDGTLQILYLAGHGDYWVLR